MSRGVAAEIGAAVEAWLGMLDPEQCARATFPFDSPERYVWSYLPSPRLGLSFAEMQAPSRDAAQGILDAALSERGAAEVREIIALEPILGELERATVGSSPFPRDPERFWFAIFGTPGSGTDEPWSWRIGGHHVAIQSTIAAGHVVASTPSFLGANPATVPGGPFAGGRALAGEETLARAVLDALSPTQRDIAIVDPAAPPDILSGSGRRAEARDVPIGIRHDQLDNPGRAGLERLVRHYLDRVRPEVADAEWRQLEAAGLSDVTFAWAGSDVPGRGHYYAIRGPSLLIEYDNTQDGANHIHAVWRDLANDWGEDLLATHYRAGHPPG